MAFLFLNEAMDSSFKIGYIYKIYGKCEEGRCGTFKIDCELPRSESAARKTISIVDGLVFVVGFAGESEIVNVFRLMQEKCVAADS